MGGDARVPRRLVAAALHAAWLASVAACGCGGGAHGAGDAGEPASRQDAHPSDTSSPDARAGDLAPPGLDVDTHHPGAAWQLRVTSTGAVVAEHLPERLASPILPGSVAKVVTALAALDQGRDGLRVACPRRLTIQGRQLDCVHPPRAEPFTLADALAHSCNTYFTRLADTLDFTAWQRLAERLGVPAATRAVHPSLLAIGLEGPMAPATTWRRVLLRAVADDRVPPAHRRLLASGLRNAARVGTADVLASDWHDTLAKTGSAVGTAGPDGLIVAWRPDEDLDLVVRVRGAGRDAAAVAAAVFEREGSLARVVRVGRRDGTIDVMPMERYVALVVAAEAEGDTPPAALRALAVASRTFAVAARGRHPEDAVDVCDSTHCQALAARPSAEALAAAEATRALVLADGQALPPVYYSASCDGTLANVGQTWGGDEPTWSHVGAEPFPHPVVTWEAELPAAALADALRHEGLRGEVLRNVVTGPSADGRPSVVHLDGLSPSRISADRFRTIVGRHLGWQVMKGHTWRLTRTSAGYRVHGRGKGHGVGLCLAGAGVAATDRGLDAQGILAAYYPRLHLRSLGDAVTLRVSAATQARAPHLLREVYAHLASLRQLLSTAAPRRITVVEHPTVEAYQRATGRAWWTGGSTRHTGGVTYRIDLPPLARLEAAGDVGRLLRHELTHVLTSAALHEAPLWAHEGLATLLAGPATPSPRSVATACPSDDVVARPGGAARMREVYAAAARCVSDGWRDGGWRALADRVADEPSS